MQATSTGRSRSRPSRSPPESSRHGAGPRKRTAPAHPAGGREGSAGGAAARSAVVMNRIFRSAPPGDEPKLGVAPCGTPKVRKGPHGVVEEHNAEARNDHVETLGLEGVVLRAGADEGCRQAFPFGAGLALRRSSAPKCRCQCSARSLRAAARRRAWCCPCRSRRRAPGPRIAPRPLRRAGLRKA